MLSLAPSFYGSCVRVSPEVLQLDMQWTVGLKHHRSTVCVSCGDKKGLAETQKQMHVKELKLVEWMTARLTKLRLGLPTTKTLLHSVSSRHCLHLAGCVCSLRVTNATKVATSPVRRRCRCHSNRQCPSH